LGQSEIAAIQEIAAFSNCGKQRLRRSKIAWAKITAKKVADCGNQGLRQTKFASRKQLAITLAAAGFFLAEEHWRCGDTRNDSNSSIRPTNDYSPSITANIKSM
jgi:hypothetical protein